MRKKLQNYDLTKGSVWKIMIMFAFPIFLGTLFQSLYTTADAIIIGNFSGKDALAAIESVHTLTKMPINFFTGLASASTIIISQYYGAKDEKQVSDACHNAILFAFVGGIVLAVIGCITAPLAVNLIHVPQTIINQAMWYIIIYFAGMVVSMLYNVGSAIFRAIGDSKTPFYFLIIANFLNIILDLIFIIGFKLGVIGAASATVLSQCLSAFLIIKALTKTNLPCKIYINKLRFHKKHLKEIFKIGLPIGIQSTLYPISNTVVQTGINSIGVDGIAAWAVCGKLDFLVWSISDAFCISVSTFVAQNFGAQKYKRTLKGVKAGLTMALTFIGMVSVVLFFSSKYLAYIFVKDEIVIDLTSEIMHIIAPLYVIYAFSDVLSGAIKGTGETIRPMLITLLGTCVTRVLWILFIVPLNTTLITILSCYPVSWGITAAIYLIFYFLRFSKLEKLPLKIKE